jgi:membrane protein DedA with SNARE-associated domain
VVRVADEPVSPLLRELITGECAVLGSAHGPYRWKGITMPVVDVADGLLLSYGYWAILLVVAIESTGIPVPGETMLIAAGIYAGATHHLNIALVIAAAATGAILGDNLGYLAGREGGYRLLHRYGRYIRLGTPKY